MAPWHFHSYQSTIRLLRCHKISQAFYLNAIVFLFVLILQVASRKHLLLMKIEYFLNRNYFYTRIPYSESHLLQPSLFLGYTKDENGYLIIEPEGAMVVKRIYREYLEGKSLKNIADGLTAEGYLTASGKSKWRPDGIRLILTNEKYMGDALLQKTYTVDVLTKKRVNNNGIVPQYYVENNHEAIIPRELFMQVQEELQRRANLRTGNANCKKKRVYSSKYALSTIVFCGKCGDLYRRVAWNSKERGQSYVNWRCANRIENGPSICDADTISERELQNAVVRAINKTLGGKDIMLEKLKKNVESVLLEDKCITTEYIDSRLIELQEELVKAVGNQDKIDKIAEEIDDLHSKKSALLLKAAERDTLMDRIEEMRTFLEQQTSRITEYDEQLVRRMIEKIIVFPDKLEFTFKSGTSITL